LKLIFNFTTLVHKHYLIFRVQYCVKKDIKILIIDDYPLIIEAYKNIFNSEDFEDYNLSIDDANSCDVAMERIDSASSNSHYDLILIDVEIPPASNSEIISGEDLAVFAKKKLPKSKIIIFTKSHEGHRIHNILQIVNPDGFLIKSDLNREMFIMAFHKVLNAPPYYSATVANYFRKQSVNFGESLLDDINRKIIFHLSKGIKTKNLTNYIDLSLSAIEKRKVQIKNLFELNKANDEALISEAKKRGFI